VNNDEVSLTLELSICTFCSWFFFRIFVKRKLLNWVWKLLTYIK